MRRFGLGVAALLILLLAAACEGHGTAYPTDTAVPQLVVHGVLVAGQDDQEIVVEYTRPLSAGLYRGLTPATSALVEVEHAGTVHRFLPVAAEPGVYRGQLSPSPGGVYTLRVLDPLAGDASGVATMPAAPVLVIPSRDTVIAPVADLVVRWRSATGAAAYMLVHIHPETGHASASGTTTDTTTISSLAFAAAGSWRIAVVSLDANLLRYRFVMGEDDRLLPARSSIQGGFGVFGALAHSQRPLVQVAP